MRKTQILRENWLFTGQDAVSQSVTLPHTWNAVDGQDGGNDYYRGSCRYETDFACPSYQKGEEQVYLEFDGVAMTTQVKLNGHILTTHRGGYSRFRVDITDALQEENHLELAVDNGVNGEVYPQKADFTFYGGIYRTVRLCIVNKTHFDMDYFGGSGIRLTPKLVGADAVVQVDSWHTNDKAQVHIELSDAEGTIVATGEGERVSLTITNAHLWHGVEDPYLYQMTARLLLDGIEQDRVNHSFGVRSFSVDADKGFFLNGKPYPLRGVSRHQDWKGIGSAIEARHHDMDMSLIREIGANTIRLAHYQHDAYFLELCDRYGMVVWAEIPYISEHMPQGRENTVQQMTELIVQQYHHPSIVTWGISNEITISTKDKNDMLDNHHQLNELCHRLDPTRLTSAACYAMCSPFNRSAHITDLISWNLYLGWYVPGLFLNDVWMRLFHLVYPKRPLGFSEYGCEGMPNLHSSKPKRGDHTEEYQAIYHEYMLRCFARNGYLWSTHVWNMFDFAADARDQGGEAGMNHKGLVSFDRQVKKDSFYLYKAHWSKEPFVHICSKRYVERTDATAEVKVYTNQTEVSLYLNGKLLEKQTGAHIFRFRVPLGQENQLRVTAGDCDDTALIRRVEQSNPAYRLKNTKSANWVG